MKFLWKWIDSWPGRIIGFIWLLPITILVWILYITPLILTQQIIFICHRKFICFFRLNEEKNNWYMYLWKKWAGWSGPCVAIIKRNREIFLVRRTWLHEEHHCRQQFLLGIFFYIFYGLFFLLYLLPGGKKPYRDNPFEKDARKIAGQE